MKRIVAIGAWLLTTLWASGGWAGVTITEFDTPTGDGAPQMITAGHDVPGTDPMPWGIAAGPDGNLWFTQPFADAIGRVTTAGVFDQFALLNSGSYPLEIVLGPDGNLWFVEIAAAKIAKVTPTGTFTEYPIPSGNGGIWGIVAGTDGNLWFTQRTAGTIARVTPSGGIAEYQLPTKRSGPDDVAVGADGNLWVTENDANKIAKVVDHGDPACPPVPSMTCDEAVRASLRIRDHSDPTRRVLLWRWTGGASSLTQADFGDPPGGDTSYTLCVYDQSGGTPV